MSTAPILTESNLTAPQAVMTKYGLVPSFYNPALHAGNEEAVVTQGGVALERNGKVLLVGNVPQPFRYAIGPVVDGRAELIPSHEFERLHERAYVEWYALAGQKPDDPNCRYVPNIRDFVMKQVRAQDDKVVPFASEWVGTQGEREEFYSPEKDRMVKVDEIEVKKDDSDTKAALQAVETMREEMEKLKSQNADLQNQLSSARAEPEEVENPLASAAGVLGTEDVASLSRTELMALVKNRDMNLGGSPFKFKNEQLREALTTLPRGWHGTWESGAPASE